MNTAQKVILTVGILVFLYLFFGTNVGETKRVLTIKYKDNLVEYVCQNAEEHKIIMLKSQHDILYFDGEYVFSEAPSDTNKKVSQAKVVRDEAKLINGDTDSEDLSFWLFVVVVVTLMLLGMAMEGDPSDSYGEY